MLWILFAYLAGALATGVSLRYTRDHTRMTDSDCGMAIIGWPVTACVWGVIWLGRLTNPRRRR